METKNYQEVKTLLEKELETSSIIKVSFDGSIHRVRKVYGNNKDLFVLGKGKKSYGNYLYDFINRSHFSDIKVIKPKRTKTEEEKWLYIMNSIKQKLEKSGLWKDLLKDINIAISVGFENIKLADELYWKKYDDKKVSYEEGQCKNAKLIKAIDKRLVTDGGAPITAIIWYYSKIPRIKKMRFSKYDNDSYLESIKKCLKNKKKEHLSNTLGYDVSFSYIPKINKAFYSEEFRNCGNGHYYLALDSTHALFYEDD